MSSIHTPRPWTAQSLAYEIDTVTSCPAYGVRSRTYARTSCSRNPDEGPTGSRARSGRAMCYGWSSARGGGRPARTSLHGRCTRRRGAGDHRRWGVYRRTPRRSPPLHDHGDNRRRHPPRDGGPDFGNGGPGGDNLFGQKGNDLIISDTVGADLLSGGAGDDPCLSAFDGRDDDPVLGGDGEDMFNADDGDSSRRSRTVPRPAKAGRGAVSPRRRDHRALAAPEPAEAPAFRERSAGRSSAPRSR